MIEIYLIMQGMIRSENTFPKSSEKLENWITFWQF